MQKSLLKISLVLGFITICVIAIATLNSCNPTELKDSNYKNVFDSYGREVKISKNVQKIATVGSATRYVVYAGAQNMLVGITDMDRPTELRPYTLAYPELFEKLPSTNNGNHINATNIDEEKMISLDPDVIISTRSADECQQLQINTKIPVVGINCENELQSDRFSTIMKIVGDVTNTYEKSNTLAGYLKSILNEINSNTVTSNISIYRGAINYKGSKDLTGTYSNFPIYEYIKANSVSDIENFNGAYDTSLEQIVNWNPEYIFIDYSNVDKIKDQKAENSSVFSALRAFKNGNVYFCPPYNNNATNVEYAMCEIIMTAKVLFPQTFKYIDLDTKYGEIFEKFLGKNIWPELQARGVTIGQANL